MMAMVQRRRCTLCHATINVYLTKRLEKLSGKRKQHLKYHDLEIMKWQQAQYYPLPANTEQVSVRWNDSRMSSHYYQIIYTLG